MKTVNFHLHGFAPILSESQFLSFRPDSAGKNLLKTYFQDMLPVFYEHRQLLGTRKKRSQNNTLLGRQDLI
jgi:hypothetical protein